MKLPSFIFKAAFASGIAALTIGALPAQAQRSTLGWSDTTTDFYDDAVDDGDFKVEFSSFKVGRIAAIDVADGFFSPPFLGAPPPYLVKILNDPTGMFTGDPPAIAPSLYKLTNDLVFQFDIDGVGGDAEAIVSLLGETEDITFLGEKNLSDALEFELEKGNWFVQLDKDNDGTYETKFYNTSSVLEFGQTKGSSFGVYAAEDTVDVPGPLPLLGAGMAFGFSRKLRSRIKARAQA